MIQKAVYVFFLATAYRAPNLSAFAVHCNEPWRRQTAKFNTVSFRSRQLTKNQPTYVRDLLVAAKLEVSTYSKKYIVV